MTHDDHDPYDGLTNADVMSAAELAEYDRDAEFRLDAEQEARDAREQDQAAADEPEGECIPELIDGTLYGCGVCEPCQDAQQDADDDEAEWVAS
ncbi:hypothetical protein ABZX95_17525 [Streptomyces sp. NPDC004232]|uniref:hypothetical protein n=1 Tax=Streptomyces sp. NPDC004232 TaxID=3154454 RepID=UPI0033BA628F